MLVNLLDNKYDAAHQTWSPEDNSIMGLIMTILSVIFMKGNVLSEEDLYDLLTRLGITLDRPDDTFGEVKHLIMTDFVRQACGTMLLLKIISVITSAKEVMFLPVFVCLCVCACVHVC